MTGNKLYAGIGSRGTPPTILRLMSETSYHLAKQGWTLQSGGAVGADTAFEKGCDAANGTKHIFTAHSSNCIPDWAFDTIDIYHPNPGALNPYVRRLMARNAQIVNGVSFILCWTPQGQVRGGTGQGLRIANAIGIPVFNMFYVDVRERLMRFISSAGKNNE